MSKARDEYYNSTPEMQCKRAYQYIKELEAEKAELIEALNTIGSLLNDSEIAQAQAVIRYTELKFRGVVE